MGVFHSLHLWSSKFFGYKHPVPMCNEEGEIEETASRAQTHPDFLDECRSINVDFHRRFFKLF